MTPSGLHPYVGSSVVGRCASGTVAKNLLGLPWWVAFALQEDGWRHRSTDQDGESYELTQFVICDVTGLLYDVPVEKR
ncbi:MAG: hypothetical protein ACRDRJ_28620 [Streptosporangiaceae bacterium]